MYVRIIWAMLVAALLFPGNARATEGECVALLHGLWRTENSMNKMEKRLREHGFTVANIKYDSRDAEIDVLAAETLPRAVAACEGTERIHFVTHSMGGILLRSYLKENDIAQLGRSVMLGPPNQGSEVIDNYADIPGFEWFSGPAGLQLGTGSESVPRALGPVRFDVGVIAGTRSINPILSMSLPGPDDGKVSVDSTRVDGAADHIEMETNHVFMMRKQEVIEQVIFYLENGRFNRDVAYLDEP